MSTATLIDSMGDDVSVVNAARVSFAKAVEEFSEKDAKLLDYLARNGHWTPFGHVTATFLVSAPIFVARQLMKHQVGLTVNEVSRRYVHDDLEFWSPKDDGGEWRLRHEDKKQGSAGTHPASAEIQQYYMAGISSAVEIYQEMIAGGVCPEQARAVLPHSLMTTWWWTGSLAAFARVCAQRIHDHAQQETRVIAEAIDNQMLTVASVSWEVLRKYSA